MTEIADAVERLIGKHKGLRKAALAVGIKAPYLCRLRNAERTNPSDAVLRKLGLKRLVTYKANGK